MTLWILQCILGLLLLGTVLSRIRLHKKLDNISSVSSLQEFGEDFGEVLALKEEPKLFK